MGKITTHVLDVARGTPGSGIPVVLLSGGTMLCGTNTNADGRTDAPLLEGAALTAGVFELVFEVEAYLALHHPPQPAPPFLDRIVLRFGIADATRPTHIALLLSPYGYTTYRGS